MSTLDRIERLIEEFPADENLKLFDAVWRVLSADQQDEVRARVLDDDGDAHVPPYDVRAEIDGAFMLIEAKLDDAVAVIKRSPRAASIRGALAEVLDRTVDPNDPHVVAVTAIVDALGKLVDEIQDAIGHSRSTSTLAAARAALTLFNNINQSVDAVAAASTCHLCGGTERVGDAACPVCVGHGRSSSPVTT